MGLRAGIMRGGSVVPPYGYRVSTLSYMGGILLPLWGMAALFGYRLLVLRPVELLFPCIIGRGLLFFGMRSWYYRLLVLGSATILLLNSRHPTGDQGRGAPLSSIGPPSG